jgi:hypothetical protein
MTGFGGQIELMKLEVNSNVIARKKGKFEGGLEVFGRLLKYFVVYLGFHSRFLHVSTEILETNYELLCFNFNSDSH